MTDCGFLILAADSGGSKTSFRLFDRGGRILGESRGPGIASVHAGELPVADFLRRGLDGLIPEKGMPRLVYLSLGGPNVAEAEDALQSMFPSARVAVEREADGKMILAGAALRGCDAALLIGTGSVGMGIRAGRPVWTGGWGPSLDDAGSGSRLGLDALRTWLLSFDGRSGDRELSPVFASLSEGLDTGTFSGRMELKRRACALSRAEIAAFAKPLFGLWREGNAPASRLVRGCAGEIASLAASLTEPGVRTGILACGGMFQAGEDFRNLCRTALEKIRPESFFVFYEKADMLPFAAVRALKLDGVEEDALLRSQL